MTEKGTWLGPLTTTWTMPSTCTLLYPWPDYWNSTMYAYRGQRCDTSVGPKDGKDCWPPRRKEVQDKESAIGG
ncbi:uncharacterized protein G6M90_00g005650 [Metarhizium brunneum]|nr:hypothetical protein G6M90_00g005650 [Metarhizium brunneum]